MNVIEYIPSLGDAGAETLVKDYCVLSKKYENISVIPVVLWGNSNSANEKILNDAGIEILSIYPKKNLFARLINRFVGNIYVTRKLNAIIRTHDVNVLHVHLPLLHQMIPLSKINSDIRFFYTCHNLPNYYFPTTESQEYKAASFLFNKNRLKMIALHDEMKDELNRMFSVTTTGVIHNGIDMQRFKMTKITKEKKREELGIPKEAFVIGHIGRFAPQKNHKFLVDVFEQVFLKNPNAYLLMVGEGELRENVEKQLKEKKLSQYQILSKRADVNEILKTMDVFAFPSAFEGLGIVLIEAQASGIRCVCSEDVPTEAYVSKNIIPVSLKKDASIWADIILNPSLHGNYEDRIDSYDMNNELEKLIGLYMESLRGKE